MRKISIRTILLILPLLIAASCEDKPENVYTNIEGVYTCNERSAHAGIRNFLVEVDKVQAEQNLYIIDNFHNLGDNQFIRAQLVGDTLFINNQIIENLTVNGKGAVSSDFKQIEFTYITYDRFVELDYYATFQRD
jgi:hypothetical protein